MDPSRARHVSLLSRLPRTRGDGPPTWPGASSTSGASPHTRGGPVDNVARLVVGWASPHTRGWTLLSVDVVPDHNGFPAHAGMDPLTLTPSDELPGLPRTRGDGPAAS